MFDALDNMTAGGAILLVLVLGTALLIVSHFAQLLSDRAKIVASVVKQLGIDYEKKELEQRQRIIVLLAERAEIEDAIPPDFSPHLQYRARVLAAIQEWRDFRHQNGVRV